jgi:hypothetical protein
MKRMTLLLMVFMAMCSVRFSIHASANYQTYESIELVTGKLLEDYTEKEYQSYYEKVNQRMFMGWRVHKVNDNVKATYVTETLFSYYNDGFTPIEYQYTLSRKETSKLGLSATGSIALATSKGDKLFKHNLDTSLKLSADYQVTTEDKETYEIKLEVDPGTQVNLYTYGEGKVTNGVACRYVLFVRMERGGFEVFLVTTQYQRLEKKRI